MPSHKPSFADWLSTTLLISAGVLVALVFLPHLSSSFPAMLPTWGAPTSYPSAKAPPPPAAPAQETIRGKVSIIHTDHFPTGRSAGRSVDQYFVETPTGERLQLNITGNKPQLVPNSQVEVRGTKAGDKITATPANISVTALAPIDSLGASTTNQTKKVAVLLINFPDSPLTPWTEEFVRETIFTGEKSVNAYYNESSYGAMSLTGKLRPDGDIFGYFTIPMNRADDPLCTNPFLWSNAADTMAESQGINLSGYDNFVYVFHGPCNFGGLAELAGTRSWNSAMGVGVIAHEMGHNFGMHHAGTLECIDAAGVRTPLSNNCTHLEYADPHSVMGGPLRHLHNFHTADLGFLNAENEQTVTQNGTYVIAPIEQDTNGVQALRISMNNGYYLYVEFRQPGGLFDTYGPSDSVVRGVGVRIASDYGVFPEMTKLLDVTPENSFADFTLTQGRSVAIPGTSISLRTLGAYPTGAVVQVRLDGSPFPPFMYGDVTLNGGLSGQDATVILRHVLGTALLPIERRHLADVDLDGQITRADVFLTAGAVVQLVTLPAKYGDVNRNGTVTTSDVTRLGQAADGTVTLTPETRYLGDIDRDQKITRATDVRLLLSHLNGKITIPARFGDLDGDVVLNAADAAFVDQYVAGSVQLTTAQLYLADVNLDGAVNAADAALIRSAIQGTVTLPVEPASALPSTPRAAMP